MELAQILHSPGGQLSKKLLKKGKSLKNKKTSMFSRITATAAKISSESETLTIQLSASKLPKMDGGEHFFFFRKPFYFLFCVSQYLGSAIPTLKYSDPSREELPLKCTSQKLWKKHSIQFINLLISILKNYLEVTPPQNWSYLSAIGMRGVATIG